MGFHRGVGGNPRQYWLTAGNGKFIIIDSPSVREDVPKKVYQKIQSALHKKDKNELTISLKDISVIEDNNLLISLLQTFIKTGDGVSGIRFSKSTINGHFIEETYIYRMT
jgi:hypothetical protein